MPVSRGNLVKHLGPLAIRLGMELLQPCIWAGDKKGRRLDQFWEVILPLVIGISHQIPMMFF